MTVEQVGRRVATHRPAARAARDAVRLRHRRIPRTGPRGAWPWRRAIVIAFGLVQIVIGARIVLLLVGVREGSPVVAGILDLSQTFVGPFEGFLVADLASAGSVIDIPAMAALVGWTVVELVAVWAVWLLRIEAT